MYRLRFVLIIILLVVSGMAIAEIVTVSSEVDGETYSASGLYQGRTFVIPGYPARNLHARIRVWGATPNPLKDWDFNDCWSCMNTATVQVSNHFIADYGVTKHGDNFEYVYHASAFSSHDGAHSTYNCFYTDCD